MISSSKKFLLINASLNVIKQLASVIFPLITFPYVTQTLGVVHFGQVNYTASIISYISLLAGLGINNYAIREGSRLKDDRVLFDSFINEIVTLNCLAMIVSYVVLAVIIGFYQKIEVYRTLLLIQGISVFFTVIGCEWLNTIYEDYAFITVRYISLLAIAVLLTFVFVNGPDDIYKYALISQFAPVFANLFNLIHFNKKWSIRYKLVRKREVLFHLKYVLIMFANAVSMLIYVNSDITLIGIFRGDAEVGVYSVAVKIYTIVKQLLNAMMLVAIPRMARWTGTKLKEEVSEQLDELLRGLLIFLVPAIIGLFCLSSTIIVLLSGSEYGSASIALRILAFTLLFSTGVCFYSNLVLIPNNKEKCILKATLISALMNVVLNIVFIPRFGFIAAAYTTLVSEAFSVIYMVIISKNEYFPSVLAFFLQSLGSGIIVWQCCERIKHMQKGSMVTLLLSIVVSVLCWGLYWILMLRIKSIISPNEQENNNKNIRKKGIDI